jgi:hypothetical protein
MAIQKILTRDLVLCFVAQFAFSKERKSKCQSTSIVVTVVGRSPNLS